MLVGRKRKRALKQKERRLESMHAQGPSKHANKQEEGHSRHCKNTATSSAAEPASGAEEILGARPESSR